MLQHTKENILYNVFGFRPVSQHGVSYAEQQRRVGIHHGSEIHRRPSTLYNDNAKLQPSVDAMFPFYGDRRRPPFSPGKM